jgi:hypothetical protein
MPMRVERDVTTRRRRLVSAVIGVGFRELLGSPRLPTNNTADSNLLPSTALLCVFSHMEFV